MVISKGTLIGGDVIKITQQLRDLTDKAVKDDLRNPKKGEPTQLYTVSNCIGFFIFYQGLPFCRHTR